MSNNTIKKVAVFGSGTMGLGIAGICANAGCEVLILDLKKETCDQALSKLTSGRSPVIQDPAILENISTGSFEDDMHKISECQWICEAVLEDVKIKRDVFLQAEKFRSDGSIISSNTSGIPLRDIYTDMPSRLQQDIAVTHFFNPVHVMRLVELVPGDNTRPEVITTLADFLGNTLGKGVVYAKDTVNFIGNRIGCMWVLAGLKLGERAIIENGLTIEKIDALLGEPIGLPATGLYGLTDLIGIDVMFSVAKNLGINLPENDFCRKFIQFSPHIQSMYERGQLGRKTGGGFYKLTRHDDGEKSMEIFDFASSEWRAQNPATLSEEENTLQSLFQGKSESAKFIQDLMASTLCYTADLIPEIADDIVNVDRAMRWGFAWAKGPFELIDELGAHTLIDLVNQHDMSMPNMLKVLIDSDESTFYRNQNTEFLNCNGEWESVPQ